MTDCIRNLFMVIKNRIKKAPFLDFIQGREHMLRVTTLFHPHFTTWTSTGTHIISLQYGYPGAVMGAPIAASA